MHRNRTGSEPPQAIVFIHRCSFVRMNIYFPAFIPLYLILVVFLIWYASSLAASEIQFERPKVSWGGIAIVVSGFALVQYVEYSKRYQYKGFTREQVAKRNSMETGVWLIVNNDVYDVSDFVRKHPAGAKIILKNSGKDATRHYNYHLEATKHFWRRAKIGWVVETSDRTGSSDADNDDKISRQDVHDSV